MRRWCGLLRSSMPFWPSVPCGSCFSARRTWRRRRTKINGSAWEFGTKSWGGLIWERWKIFVMYSLFFFWDEQHNLGESFFLNRSVFGFCLSKVSRICFCWFWGWHMFFSLAATGWKGKVPEWPQFIPHSVWFLLTSFNVWNFQPLVCWWWFSTPRNLERFPQETYHEIAITDHQSDYRHLGGVIGFRPPKTHRLNYIDNQNKTPEY